MSSSISSPKRIGLTGGIGCGKTTVLELFRQMGVPCFVADDVAREYYNRLDFCRQVGKAFGAEVMLPNGSIDKARLADVVFNDQEQLKRINAMIHPRVMEDFLRWTAQQQTDFVVFESAILYEYGFDKMMDYVVCVYLDKEERLRRLQLRDHATRQQIERRMANQMEAEDKMARADFVILNHEGNPRRRQVRHLIEQLSNPEPLAGKVCITH